MFVIFKFDQFVNKLLIDKSEKSCRNRYDQRLPGRLDFGLLRVTFDIGPGISEFLRFFFDLEIAVNIGDYQGQRDHEVQRFADSGVEFLLFWD